MENKQSCFKIKIEAGNEHRSISMDIYDDTAFFYDAYKRAARAVTHIVARSNEYTCRGIRRQPLCPVRISQQYRRLLRRPRTGKNLRDAFGGGRSEKYDFRRRQPRAFPQGEA